jgi:hypothetical protein
MRDARYEIKSNAEAEFQDTRCEIKIRIQDTRYEIDPWIFIAYRVSRIMQGASRIPYLMAGAL